MKTPMSKSSFAMTGRRQIAVLTAAALSTALAAMCTVAGTASASPARPAALAPTAPPTVSNLRLSGYTVIESRVSLPPDSQAQAIAVCPSGDVVVGGGGYEVTQGLGEDLNSSLPVTFEHRRVWVVEFNNQQSFSNTGVAVAICAARTSVRDYSIQRGDYVTVPANGEAQAVVTCPSGTVSLGGGGNMAGIGTAIYNAMDASAPYGQNGWRTYLSSASSDGTAGNAQVVCAAKPTGWAQVSSKYVSNPAGEATSVSVNCPTGASVLGGGPFNSSYSPLVTIGLTAQLSDLKGWNSTEDNSNSANESVDEWAVCAAAVAATS